VADRLLAAAALAAGACTFLGVLALGSGTPTAEAMEWLRRRREAARTAPAIRRRRRLGRAAPWLALRLERAGWAETPERCLLGTVAAALALASLGVAAGSLVGVPAAAAGALLGTAAGVGIAVQALRTAIHGRRRRLLAELAPTLELAGLELSGGSSALHALASVTRRTDGALAREVRLLLAMSAAGGAGFETRLRQLGERLDLPPLVAVAAVMATSRDYGSGVSQGLSAIAVDLRRAQRRELIATSRRALSRVLVPAAVGVLLPFMAVLLYPAVTTLARSFL
jgi:Flp pilus assembly protein TadB